MFIIAIHFQPSLIFAVLARAYPRGVPWVSYSLGCKYYLRVEVTEIDGRASLLHYRINYDHKEFYNTGPWDGEIDECATLLWHRIIYSPKSSYYWPLGQ